MTLRSKWIQVLKLYHNCIDKDSVYFNKAAPTREKK